ncbi:MAG TPA: 3-dehydroquinate synthase [Bacillota bacterium]|nr:3-dehydroquinate synthase [Bacillota bacterium]HOA90786.1 3-dehydroquinate synthase [Bacillota bacterium]HOJ46772.1 3-dehydroquinate synthase [Bacillota bacterium]HPZ72878.1 3-dehydroquinate synthase [Bacillota bacterium]HQD77448.1 3-dehydroquinate synthase [Bacillota bacterium]
MDVALNLPNHSYTIYIEPGILTSVGRKIKELDISLGLAISKVLIVADSNTAPLYLEEAVRSFQEVGYEAFQMVLPAGEIFKTAASVELIWEKALDSGLDRKSLMVALGGGVVSDLTGFAAATYLRGLYYASIPTTLLSQVDASVGGKTGFNLKSGKNLVGAFYQPIGVFADPNTLLSLSQREYRNGYAEVIKHALLSRSDLLVFLEGNLEKIESRDPWFLAKLVEKNVRIKADVVASDEKEAGRRAILNLGHTLGHALEELGGYKDYSHGEAVAIGMTAACAISLRRGLITEQQFARVKSLIEKVGLPTKPSSPVEPWVWWEKTYKDKKAASGVVYWVLPQKNQEGNLEFPFDHALFGVRVEYEEFQSVLDLLGE